MTTRTNSLQAVLERQAASTSAPSLPAPPQPAATTVAEQGSEPPVSKAERFYRPSRDGRRFLGGHFEPKVVRQMKMLAAEEDTTTQALLEEAIDLLFLKKGRDKIIGT